MWLRNNILTFLALPARLDRTNGKPAFIDKLLAPVPAVARLTGLIAVVACVSAARNMAFVWMVLAAVLLGIAIRPAAQLRVITSVAGVAALVGGLLATPAVLLGLSPTSIIVRMAIKTFCTVALTLRLAQGVSWPRMMSSLTALRVPATLTFVLDGTMRGITLLGRTAARLTEALALRDVGSGVGRDASVGGVLGMTFLRSAQLADAQSEAMLCRGYNGLSTTAPERASAIACVIYLACIAGIVALFLHLEHAMGA